MEMTEGIRRRTMLYQTKVEYGDYAMNHVLGCSQGCRYPCYSYLQKKRFGQVKTMEEWENPKLVENTLELLGKEIPRLAGRIDRVNLCFTTDPFMHGHPEVTDMSLKAIRMLNAAGIRCVTLTKGVTPVNELIGLDPRNEYGISLVSVNEDFRREWEPGAASVIDRLGPLWAAHEAGLHTWVSMEPYPTPKMFEQDMDELLSAVSCADKVVFGRVNYSPGAGEFKGFYERASRKVLEAGERYGFEVVIKKGTPRPVES